MIGVTYAKAVENAEALKALGNASIYLSDLDEDEAGFPWDLVTNVEPGNTHSYIGPRSIGFIAQHPSGLTFRWSVDLSPTHMGVEKRPFFDHTAISAMAERLSPAMRKRLARVLTNEVLPPLEKQIKEARAHLNALLEGETTLRGIGAKVEA